jgi:hypothetical protein
VREDKEMVSARHDLKFDSNRIALNPPHTILEVARRDKWFCGSGEKADGNLARKL